MAERTLLSLATSAAHDAGAPAPSTIVGNNEKIARAILGFANDTVRAVRTAAADNGGWGAQQVGATLSLVSGVASYDLPDDYQAMIPGAIMLDGMPMWFSGPDDPAYWNAYEANALVGVSPYRWRVKARKIFVQPTPSSSMTVVYEYLTRSMIESTAAGAWDVAVWDQAVWDATTISDRFLDDDDQPRFPDYLLKLGVQYRLERLLGRPYGETANEFENELEIAVAEDHGGPPRSRSLCDVGDRASVAHGLGSSGFTVFS